MGYVKTKARLVQMFPYLTLLREGKECVWHVEPGQDPEKVAHRIREALYIANLYAGDFPDLARAYRRFAIKVEGNRIVARFLAAVTINEAFSLEDFPDLPSANPLEVIRDLPRPKDNVALLGKKSLDDVRAMWELSNKDRPMHFADAALSYADMLALFHWAKAQESPLMILEAGDAITLSHEDPAVVEFEWKPL